MTITEFARLVRNMRSAQDPFGDLAQPKLTASLEREVDAAVKEVLDAANIEAGEKAFESGGQEWVEWNMANNPFGD